MAVDADDNYKQYMDEVSCEPLDPEANVLRWLQTHALELDGSASTTATIFTRNLGQEVLDKEFKVDKWDNLFAATPPLEAMQLLLSFAVTEANWFKTGSKQAGNILDFIDIRRTYYHAPARVEVYVKSHPRDEEEGVCGQLIRSLPGTRGGVQIWEG